MYRYFYIRDQRKTVKLIIEDDSPASTAPIEAFMQYFNSQYLQELTPAEYKRINEEDCSLAVRVIDKLKV